MPIDVLGERARQSLVSRQTKQVFLRMDAGVNAQEFLNVIDSLKDGGVEAIGLVALDAPDAVRQQIRNMEAVVSDILQSRKREPDGLKKTAAISLAAHAAAHCRPSDDPERDAARGAAAARRHEHQPRRRARAEHRRDADDRRTADSGCAAVDRSADREERRRRSLAADAAEDGAAGSETEAAHATEADRVV